MYLNSEAELKPKGSIPSALVRFNVVFFSLFACVCCEQCFLKTGMTVVDISFRKKSKNILKILRTTPQRLDTTTRLIASVSVVHQSLLGTEVR